MQHSFVTKIPSSFKPAVALSKVPPVRQLCERLGFQHASLKDTNTFMEASRAWRKSFTTSSGRHAPDLLNWNDPLDQSDLTEMAEKFLDMVENGETYGERFWSPSRSWNHDTELKFPEDRLRIVELLKQLFWKQNRYAFNNSHYGHKDTEPRDTSRDTITPLRQTSPEIHSAPPSADASGQAKPNSPRNFSSRTKANHMTQTFGNSSIVRVDAHEHDIYEFPSDSDSDQDPMRHKRPRAHSNTGGTPPKKKIKTKDAVTPRRTDRKRMTRNIPDKVPDQLAHQIIDLSSDEVDPDDHSGNVQPAETAIRIELPTPSSTSSTRKHYPPTAPMLDKRKSLSPKSKGSKTAQEIGPTDPSKSSTSSSSPSHSSSATKKTKVLKLPVKPSYFYTSPYVEDESVISPVATKESTHVGPVGVLHGKPLGHRAKGSDASDPVLPQPKPPVREQRDRPYTTTQTKDGVFAHPVDSVPVLQMTFQDIEPVHQNPPKNSTAESITTSSSASTPAPKPGPAHPSPSQIPPSKPRQKTQIPLWIITREPRCTEERWDDGKFMGTPLASFIEGISKFTQRGHIEKIKLTLRAPTFDTKITVFKDAEDSWASAKETFVEKLKEAKAEAKARRQEQVSFKILVEPFYEEGFVPSGSIDEDEEEFEF